MCYKIHKKLANVQETNFINCWQYYFNFIIAKTSQFFLKLRYGNITSTPNKYIYLARHVNTTKDPKGGGTLVKMFLKIHD